MSFVQPAFPLFFVLVFLAVWGLRAARAPLRVVNLVLLLASGVFYVWVHPWYLGLLAFSILLDFGVALAMVRWPGRRGALLGASVAGNLGMLGLFKYHDFFADSVAGALGALGVAVTPHRLGVLLPVGISFYTFQTLSYTIDVYRGRLEPRRSLVDHATFVALFPQLVAGPVERARDLLPQLESPRTWVGERFVSGLSLALWGAVQKFVVADTLALYVDKVFLMPAPGRGLLAAGTLAFTVQILADFSGYSDIARGTARMLGFELTRNFRAPFLARSPSEFWRRWHVSFSSWKP